MNDIKNKNQLFSSLLNRLIKKIYSLDRNEKICFGVSVSQYYILEILNQKESISMNELSREMDLAISTVTRMVDILVRDKLVKRLRSEKDRRKVLVKLSERGEVLFKKLKECTLIYSSAILENISESRRGDIISALAVLNEAVNDLNTKCCKPVINQRELEYDK